MLILCLQFLIFSQLISVRILFLIEILFFRVSNEHHAAKLSGLVSAILFEFLVTFERIYHYFGTMSWNALFPWLLGHYTIFLPPWLHHLSCGALLTQCFQVCPQKSVWTLSRDSIWLTQLIPTFPPLALITPMSLNLRYMTTYMISIPKCMLGTLNSTFSNQILFTSLPQTCSSHFPHLRKWFHIHPATQTLKLVYSSFLIPNLSAEPASSNSKVYPKFSFSYNFHDYLRSQLCVDLRTPGRAGWL